MDTNTPMKWPFTPAQADQLAGIIIQAIQAGEEPESIENTIRDWLRDLPDGALGDWQIDELAQLLTVAALLAAITHRRRLAFN